MNVTRLFEERVALIREFIEEHSPDYLWVPISGGKDSAAAWSLTSMATREYIAVYIMIPGQTHSDNVKSVTLQAEKLGVRDILTTRVDRTREIRVKLQDAVETCARPCLLRVLAFDTYGRNYWEALSHYGFPAPLGRFGRGTRWCCGTFKHRVLQRLPCNGRRDGKPWKYGVNGVKATDSPYRRRKYRSIVQTWERTRDTYLFPLLDLEDAHVWAILEHIDLADVVRPQYDKWGRSPNCMWCPLLGRKSAERTVQALPRGARKVIAGSLEKLLPRYRPGTYSHRMILMWLSLLEASNMNLDAQSNSLSTSGKPLESILNAPKTGTPDHL